MAIRDQFERIGAAFANNFLGPQPSRPSAPEVARPSSFSDDSTAVMAATVVALACVFNAVLALINAHVFSVGNNVVVLVQGAIVGFSAIMALGARSRGGMTWLVIGWAIILLWLLMCFSRNELDLKALGDMIVPPIFVSLGLLGGVKPTFRMLVVLQMALVIFAGWELFFPASFGDLFAVQQYYINTRGFTASAFWAGNNNLFISAQRPGGRLISLGFDVARSGSLFLEPVSLGNWTVVVWAALAAFHQELGRRTKVFLVVTNLMLLFACDGRLALGLMLAMPIGAWITTRFAGPARAWLPALYLPAIFVLLLIGAGTGYFTQLDRGLDDLHGRLARGIFWILSLNLQQLLGAMPGMGGVAADSGWMQIILSQSILGLILVWLMLTVVPGQRQAPAQTTIRLVQALAIYVAFTLPISNSTLSIKTGGMLWYLIGLAIMADKKSIMPEKPQGRTSGNAGLVSRPVSAIGAQMRSPLPFGSNLPRNVPMRGAGRRILND